MALTNAGSPTGSHTHRITGTGSWDDLVTLIADTAVIDSAQSYYEVQGKLELECTLDPLYDAIVHCHNGGGFSVKNGGSVTFGAEITYNGKTSYWHGCTIIEDADSWARGSDNYGGANARMRGSSSVINLYDSQWRFLNSSRSDPDFAEGTFKIRQSQFYTAIANWMHMFCTVDWDDFENWLDSSSGSTTEFSADTVITLLNNYTPYKSGTGRQLVFYNGVPAQPIVNYGGLNFARWQGSSASIIYFDNPVATALASVESTTGQFVAQERRSLEIGAKVAGVGSQVRFCAEDVDGVDEINTLTDSSGVLDTYLIRQRWPLSTHTPVTHTPHVLRVHKYGYTSQEILLDVTPTVAAQGGFQLPLALVADATNTQTKAAALAHTGITITYEATPVTWNSKDFSITVEGDLSVNASLTAQDIRHYINAENDDGTQLGTRQPHELIAASLATQVGTYYDGVKGVRVVDEAGNAFPGITQMQADDGTFYSVPTTDDLFIASSESSSLIQVFETGTQTIIDSTTGSNLTYTHSNETVDIVVQKAGFIPQRQTAVVLSGDVNITITLVRTPVYNASHGLTYTTDFSYNRSTKILTLNNEQDGRNVFSALIDAFIAQTSLRNTEFNFSMNGPDSFIFLDDAEFVDSSSENNIIGTGIQYQNTSGTATAEWCAVRSIGTATGFTGEYQQVAGSGTTDAKATGAFNQVIQTYGDASHGNFDYRDHLVLKFQPNGYKESRADVLSIYNTTALEPLEYVVAMQPSALAVSAGDPAISITLVDHTAAPISVGGKSFDYEVQDNGANSASDILRELNYNLSLDATYESKDPFNWPSIVVEEGSNFATQYGTVEDETGLHGFYVSRSAADHPGFSRFQSNDGTYYTPPTTAGIAAASLTAGRVQLYNVTTATEIENTTITSGYSRNWTDGTDATAGDVLRLRWVAADSLGIEASAVATADTTVSILSVPEDDTVYNAYAIDGSTVTEYAADYPNVEVDVTDPDNVFYLDRFYAWWKYNLTTATGINDFWGGLTATNTSNLVINNSVLDIYFDNTKATSARQGDTIVLTRADGAYPQASPTSGGGGLGFYYAGIGYSTSSGSGLDTTERNKLLGLRDFDPDTDVVEGSETWTEAQRLIRAEAAGKVGVSGNTVTFRDAADTKNRITATTDTNGQRTAVTTDAS